MVDLADRVILGMNVVAVLVMVLPTVMVIRTEDPHNARPWFIEMMFGGATWGVSSILQVTQLASPEMVDGLRTLGWFLVLCGWVLFACHFPRRLRLVDRYPLWLVVVCVHLPLLVIGSLRVTTHTMFYMEAVDGRYVLQRGSFFYLSLGFGYGYCLLAMAKLLLDRLRLADPTAQTQAALVFAAGLPTVLLNVVEIVFLPTRSAFTSIGFCLTGTLLGVGVVKYRMFGVTRLFQQGLTAAFTSVLAGLLFRAFEEGAESAFASLLPTGLYVPPSLVAALLVGGLFIPLHQMSRRISGGMFPRLQYLEVRLGALDAAVPAVKEMRDLLTTVRAFEQRGERQRARRLLEVAEAKTLLLEADASEELPFQYG